MKTEQIFNIDVLTRIKNDFNFLLELKYEFEHSEKSTTFHLTHVYHDIAFKTNMLVNDAHISKYFINLDKTFFRLLASTAESLNHKGYDLIKAKKLKIGVLHDAFHFTEEIVNCILPELDLKIKYLKDNNDEHFTQFILEDESLPDSDLGALYLLQKSLSSFINLYSESKSNYFKFNGFAVHELYDDAEDAYNILYSHHLQNLLEKDEWSIISSYVLGIYYCSEILMNSREFNKLMYTRALRAISDNYDFISDYVNALIKKYEKN